MVKFYHITASCSQNNAIVPPALSDILMVPLYEVLPVMGRKGTILLLTLCQV